MTAGFLQYEPAFLDVQANIDRVSQYLAGAEADLLVLPELFATGYHFGSPSDLAAVAESTDAPGETLDAMRAWSMSMGATIVGGYVEKAGGVYFNSAAVVGRGAIVGNYRKVHLFYREKQFFAPGGSFAVFEVQTRDAVPYRVGVMVCFDWYFPEAARTLALKGADVIAHPANLVRKDCPRSMPIRALENHVFTVTANRVGSETTAGETLRFIGQSLACDPRGEVLASADATESVLRLFECDPTAARNRKITATNDLFGDRRPEAYDIKKRVTQ